MSPGDGFYVTYSRPELNTQFMCVLFRVCVLFYFLLFYPRWMHTLHQSPRTDVGFDASLHFSSSTIQGWDASTFPFGPSEINLNMDFSAF